MRYLHNSLLFYIISLQIQKTIAVCKIRRFFSILTSLFFMRVEVKSSVAG